MGINRNRTFHIPPNISVKLATFFKMNMTSGFNEKCLMIADSAIE